MRFLLATRSLFERAPVMQRAACISVRPRRGDTLAFIPLRLWPRTSNFSSLQGSHDHRKETPDLTPLNESSSSVEADVNRPIAYDFERAVISKAADAIISDEEASYLIPMYIGEDGGHGHKISQWYKEEGDEVSNQEAICEIETNEFLYDFVAQDSGFLAVRGAEECLDLDDRDMVALVAPTEENLIHFQQRFRKLCSEIEAQEAEATAQGQIGNLSSVCPELKALLISTSMERYAHDFVEEGFDTKAALSTVTDEDLKELGVKAGHRRVLLAALVDISEDIAEERNDNLESNTNSKITAPSSKRKSGKKSQRKKKK